MKRIPHLIRPLILAALLLGSAACSERTPRPAPIRFEGLPFDMPPVALPSIPERSVTLTDFGAVPDGATLNTEAFAQAIAQLERKGGGRLVVPPGIWLSGPIELCSGIDLHLERGAVLRFSPDKKDYPIIRTSYEGREDVFRCQSPLWAEGAHDLSISGEGLIDGQGSSWRRVMRKRVPPELWDKLVAQGRPLGATGDRCYPDSSYWRAAEAELTYPGFTPGMAEAYKSVLRPVLVALRGCDRVSLTGCTFADSPAWCIHALQCKDLAVRGIRVRNPAWAENGDGIDIESSERVLVEDSVFDCGDDAVCLKSGRDGAGRARAVPCRQVVVRGCTVFAGHGGFVVGSEMSGGVENVSVSDCSLLGTETGLRFKSRRGRGGVVRNIHVRDIRMADIQREAVIIDLYYSDWRNSTTPLADYPPQMELPVDETTPQFRDIWIEGLCCDGAGRAVCINGLPEMPVQGVTIADSRFNATRGIEICRARDITLHGNQVSVTTGEPLWTAGVENLQSD